MRAHRVEDARAAFEQARQNFVDVPDRERIVGAVFLDCALRACARPVPGLASRIAVAHEQHELALRAARQQDRDGLGFLERGQVVEIAVRTVLVLDVVVAGPDRRGRQDRDCVPAHEPHQLPPPTREFIQLHAPSTPRAHPRRAGPRPARIRPVRCSRPRLHRGSAPARVPRGRYPSDRAGTRRCRPLS